MSDVQDRLKKASEACIKSHENWDANKKDSDARENLQESIHELRKVISRLEIDIAVSERDNSKGKPLPIPSHRSQSKKEGGNESILPDGGHTENNGSKSGGRSGGAKRPQRTRRPAPKKAEG